MRRLAAVLIALGTAVALPSCAVRGDCQNRVCEMCAGTGVRCQDCALGRKRCPDCLGSAGFEGPMHRSWCTRCSDSGTIRCAECEGRWRCDKYPAGTERTDQQISDEVLATVDGTWQQFLPADDLHSGLTEDTAEEFALWIGDELMRIENRFGEAANAVAKMRDGNARSILLGQLAAKSGAALLRAEILLLFKNETLDTHEAVPLQEALADALQVAAYARSSLGYYWVTRGDTLAVAGLAASRRQFQKRMQSIFDQLHGHGSPLNACPACAQTGLQADGLCTACRGSGYTRRKRP